MEYKDILNKIDEIADNLEQGDNETDFTILKMIQSIIKSQDATKREQNRQLEQEVDEAIESILERPEYYFDTKEHNIEKLMEKGKLKLAVPQSREEKDKVVINANLKLVDNLMKNLESIMKTPQNKQAITSMREEMKTINRIKDKKVLAKELRNATKKMRTIVIAEIIAM